MTISRLLAGIRNLNSEKIQRYLASELRDRIRHSGIKIKIIDRTSRLEFNVEPRQYEVRFSDNFYQSCRKTFTTSAGKDLPLPLEA